MQLIITADDFGVNKERSDGILSLARKGKISHVTALVNGEVSDAMIPLFIERRQAEKFGCSIGLHFNITEGFALSQQAQSCEVLVDTATGRFVGKTLAFLRLAALSSRHDGEVYTRVRSAIAAELAAQMKRFIFLTSTQEALQSSSAVETRWVWVDGHHHVHILPIVMGALLEFNCTSHIDAAPQSVVIGGMRLPHQQDLVWDADEDDANAAACPIDECPALARLARRYFADEESCFGERFWRSVSSLAKVYKRVLSADCQEVNKNTNTNNNLSCTGGTPVFPGAFFGLNIMGAACSAAKVLSALGSLQPIDALHAAPALVSVTEIMTHVGFAAVPPSHTDIFFHDTFSLSNEREHEMGVYEGLALPEGVVLTSCDVIMAQKRGRGVSLLHAEAPPQQSSPVTDAAGSALLFSSTTECECAESDARRDLASSECVAINTILASEVSAYLAYQRRLHTQHRTAAKAVARDATVTFMAQHAAECADRLASIEEDTLDMLGAVRSIFAEATSAVIKGDADEEVCRALIEEERARAARKVMLGKGEDFVRSYLK